MAEWGTEDIGEEKYTTIARIIYVLYLVGLVFGITALIGVVMAVIYRGDAPSDWLRENFTFQIRTFWIGLLYLFIASALTPLGIGFLLVLAWIVWVVIRCVKGLQAIEQRRFPGNSRSWLFG
ncbi:MAG: DUF4870 family protein [Pseudomonadota bacterium]